MLERINALALFREREGKKKKENNTEENIKSFLCNVCKLL